MTKLLIKTKADHRKLRAVLDENTVTLAMTPAAGAVTGGTRTVAYAGVTFALTNAVGASHFRVSAGALPLGLSLNANTGLLSGTPTQVSAGGNSFSITGNDDFGNVKTQAYTLAVA